jgi:hypothetical protein
MHTSKDLMWWVEEEIFWVVMGKWTRPDSTAVPPHATCSYGWHRLQCGLYPSLFLPLTTCLLAVAPFSSGFASGLVDGTAQASGFYVRDALVGVAWADTAAFSPPFSSSSSRVGVPDAEVWVRPVVRWQRADRSRRSEFFFFLNAHHYKS